MAIHYVYKVILESTGEFYIGSRTVMRYSSPEEDPYKGSMVTWKIDKKLLKKIVIKSDFSTRSEANLFEIKLIKRYINHPLNRNYNIPGEDIHDKAKGFGGPHTLKSKRKMSLNHNSKSSEAFRKIAFERKGKKHEEIFREKSLGIRKQISEKLSGKNNPMYKVSVREIWEKKFGNEVAEQKWNKKYDSVRGKPSWNSNIRKIAQYDINDNLLKIYEGLQDLIDKNPNFIKSNICNVLKNKRKIANGYIWKYYTH